ncbi:MAG: hypothetical protein AAGB04_30740 [Pseudomonadota bacterium]
MTATSIDKRQASRPITLALHKQANSGAKAQGCIAARSDLVEVARHIAPRSQRYASLRLTLGTAEAVFWSTQPVDLPWLPVQVTYLQPPSQQIFLPIGWAHNVADGTLSSLLADIPARSSIVGPLALLPRSPASEVSAIRLIELEQSLSVAAVDWAFLARGQE